jgi:uncharacterized membrane protein YqjE
VAANPPEHADGSVLKHRISYLRYLINDRRRRVNDRIFWMQLAATLVACFSLVVLIIAGIWPKFALGLPTTVLLLIVALLPMPTFCLYSYVSHRAWLRRIAPARKEVEREWTRLMLPIIEEVRRLSEQRAKHGT